MAKYTDYPPVEDMDGLGALAVTDVLPSVEELKSLLVVSGTAGLALVGSRMIFNKLPFISGLHWTIRAGVKVLAGAALGKFISRYNSFAGVGVGAGFIVGALVDDVLPAVPIPGISGLFGGAKEDFELFGNAYGGDYSMDVQVHERPLEEYAYGSTGLLGFEVDEQPEYVAA